MHITGSFGIKPEVKNLILVWIDIYLYKFSLRMFLR
jgi:hypothetical protein